MLSIVTQLADLLGKTRRPGDFYAQGKAELLSPSLSVQGVGSIALPLLPEQAAQLAAVAEQAPYGRGPDTVVDTAVRNTRQIGPDHIDLRGRHWPKTLATILNAAAKGLGVSDPIEAEFYKMLIYEPGSFFIGHRDTEKAPGMFATLVIALPSACSGGELVVRHKDRSVSLNLRVDDPAEAAFAAFYADCMHEVLPVTAGYRVALVYNLLRRGKGKAPLPPNYTKEQDQLTALLRDWRTKEGDNGPEKLVYPLEHAYTAPGFGFSILKGADAAAAGVLAAAAQQADCALHLALVTLEEFGTAEYSDNYGRRRRWSRDDEDEDEFTVGEIDDWTIALSNWCALDGNPVSWGEIPVRDDELSPPDPFHALKPDELHFQEASGNAGVSFERRYQRAALVVWPIDRSFAVLTQAGLGVTVPHMLDLARRWEASRTDQGSQLWQQAHDLAGHMIDDWPTEGGHAGPENVDCATTGLLVALTRLGDTRRIAQFLTRVVGTGIGYAKRDNPAIIAALALFPAEEAATMVATIVTGNAAKRFGSCADLLAHCVTGPTWPRVPDLRDAAVTLIALMPGNSAAAAKHARTPGRDTIDASFVADLLVGLGQIDPQLGDQALTQILKHHRAYDLDAVLVPAARDKLRALETAGQPTVVRLRAACLAHLRARIALPLAPPLDWKRSSTVGCRCRYCGDLSGFLADPTRQTWTLRAAAPDRSHVESTILNAKCDLDTKTEQRGRPYSLICAKNQASYKLKLKQRKKDLKDEASLSR
jgi:predicted 2-oxoglutarate/Fe(II)-dependent dioxygenase YbiX